MKGLLPTTPTAPPWQTHPPVEFELALDNTVELAGQATTTVNQTLGRPVPFRSGAAQRTDVRTVLSSAVVASGVYDAPSPAGRPATAFRRRAYSAAVMRESEIAAVNASKSRRTWSA